MSKIAVIQIRGTVAVDVKIKDTLMMLNLNKKHACAIVEDNPAYLGMLRKVKDFVTYGTITDETLKTLIDARGKKDADGNLKKTINLESPKGGFRRKGIKVQYNNGGVLGDRKEKINDLILKMI